MSNTDRANPASPDVAALLAQVDGIAGVLDATGRESERAGRLSPAAEKAMRSTDLFRLWWPPELGGPAATVREGIEVIEKMASADTSAAWNLGVCTLAGGLAGAYLSDQAIEEVFTEELTLIAGQTAPIGKGTPVRGGIEISGQWFFGSGIDLASWVKAGVMIDRGEESPRPAIALVPRDAVEIQHDSWEVAGLSGSGSYSYSIDRAFVPEGYWYDFPVAQPLRGGSTYQLPVPAQLAILHVGFPLGVARRCLDEIKGLAISKIRQFDTTAIGNRDVFRSELAQHHARLEGARLYAYDTADRLQAAAGTPGVLALMSEIRAAARYTTDIGVMIATWAYRSGGGNVLRLDHPLQRLLRDMLGATQHVFVDDKSSTDFGGVILGSGNGGESPP